MRNTQYWIFQGSTTDKQVCHQEITELANLAAGLLAFERRYCSTHGERTPVFRLLSMINAAIADNNVWPTDYAEQDPGDVPF